MGTGFKLVAAIDVGSTCSGYAYSFTNDPSNVKTSLFKNGDKTTSKVPSALLLSKDNKILAFGHEADEKYIEMEKQVDSSHKLFRRFKMNIHPNPTLSLSTTVKDVTGRHEMPVTKIIAMAIIYLKNHLMRSINTKSDTFDENEVHFMILTPASWPDRAKAFMRETAVKAGIPIERLTLALDSEVASLWFQATDDQVKAKGTKYMTVDLGGSTADISLHESQGDGSFETLHYPCGGPWGGTSADDCFLSYITLLFGSGATKTLQDNHTVDFLKMMKSFERAKRVHEEKTTSRWEVELPDSLLNASKLENGLNSNDQLEKHVSSSIFGKGFDLSGATLYISEEPVNGMFDYTVKALGTDIRELMQPGLNTVVVVGGYAESPVVQKLLSSDLQNCKLIIPPDSDEPTMMGAVLFGHNPELIKTRVTKLTYGIKVTAPFDETKHAGGESSVINGKKMCTNVFHVLLKGGSKVTVGQRVTETDMPLTPDLIEQEFEIYSTGLMDDIPTLTSHPTMNQEASFSVPLPFGCLVEDKRFSRCVVFGNAELSFEITFLKDTKAIVQKQFTKIITAK